MKASHSRTIFFAVTTLIIVFIVLMVYSFDVVPALHVGALYNSVTHQLDTETGYIFTPGRYYVSPGKRFILVPTKRINVVITDEKLEISDADYTSNSLLARTKDGLQIKVDVFCQLKLISEESVNNPAAKEALERAFQNTLRFLNFYNNKGNYLDIISTILKTDVLDAISLYESSDIYPKRSEMTANLKAKFQATMAQFGISVPSLIIPNLAYTSQQIVDAIETTQILNQNVLEMLILENSKRLQLTFLRQVNDFDNQNALSSSTTQAIVNMVKTNGTANGVNRAYNSLVAGIRNVQAVVGNDDKTVNFLLYLAIFKNTFSKNQTVLMTNAGFF